MIVEIYIYKRNDLDIFSLCDAGYSVTTMFKEALISYANSTPIHFLIDQPTEIDLNGKESIHKRITIPNSETKTIYMLKKIKHGLRSNFCKMVLRNALIQQNLCGYFADTSLMMLQNNNLASINFAAIPNVRKVSDYRQVRQVTFLGHTVVVQPKESAPLAPDPFVNMNVNPAPPTPIPVQMSEPIPAPIPMQIPTPVPMSAPAPEPVQIPTPVSMPTQVPTPAPMPEESLDAEDFMSAFDNL